MQKEEATIGLDIILSAGEDPLAGNHGRRPAALGGLLRSHPGGDSTGEWDISSGHFIRAFGQDDPEHGLFHRLIGVAVDGRGFVYATDGDDRSHVVVKFDPSGRFVAHWAGTGLGDGQLTFEGAAPVGVAGDGTVYLPDNLGSAVFVYGSDGTPLSRFGPLPDTDVLSEPGNAAVDDVGNVYVADFGNARVDAFDAQGQFLWTSSGAAAGPGHFLSIAYVAAGSGQTLFVIDDSQNLLLALSVTP